MSRPTGLAAVLGLFLLSSPGAAAGGPADDVLLTSMQTELKRSYSSLRKAEKVPLYYLGYQVTEAQTYDLGAMLGAVNLESEHRYRLLDVDVRVGSPKFDNTHQLKGREAWTEREGPTQTEITTDDDSSALRAALWLRTDRAYKDAVARYAKVEANKQVTAAEEDGSDDFSAEKPHAHYEKASHPAADAPAWRERLKKLSLAFKPFPFIFESNMALSIRTENRALVNSEGASIVDGNSFVRLSYRVAGRTEDGMDLERSRTYDSNRLEDLPGEEELKRDMLNSVSELQALLKAPIVEPFTGPAIIRNRAAGVYFHEILGHRLEGHRQKIEDEGQTFTKMLGKAVVAPFISVYDDPTIKHVAGQFLRGYYKFDDEGVAAQRVALIRNGMLKTFLLSRAPVRNFPRSNGHGRRSAGHEAVARMGNTIVEASATVPYDSLRAKLVSEIKRQKKPYGLIFEDIAGGVTATTRAAPQSFKVMPLLVYRVYPDGRPDEAVRGVDIVGTPLTAFGKIIAAGNDSAIFNGTCGAESGWVPVSAVAPSILISELEVEKKSKSSEKPPILPAPFHDGRQQPPADSKVIFQAMTDEMNRTMGRLEMNKTGKPHFVGYTLLDSYRLELESGFGGLKDPSTRRTRALKVDLRLGSPAFDQSHYVGKDYWRYHPFIEEAALDDDYDALRFSLWTLSDSAYKYALEKLAQKKAYERAKNIADKIPDQSSDEPQPPSPLPESPSWSSFEKELWEGRVRELSAVFKNYPAVQSSGVNFYMTQRHEYFVDSQGRRTLAPAHDYEVLMSAGAQGQDGLALGDRRRFIRKTPAELPSFEILQKEAESLAADMTALAAAPVMNSYVGPVILEGQAAGEFFNQLLARNISSPRSLWVEDERLKDYFNSGSLPERLGLRVIAPFLNVFDDPGLARHDGVPLLGHYLVDNEAIPARRVSVIKKGILEDLPMSRSPIKERRKSNGHGRASLSEFVAARIGNLFIEPEYTVSPAHLKEKLLQSAKDYGLPYGLIIRRISEEDLQEKDEILAAPVLVYRAYVADGREELVRGAQFSGVTLRALRDIVSASDKNYVYNFYQLGADRFNRGQVQASIVAPAVLVSEMELKKTEKKPEKLPYLAHPHFALP